MFYLFLMLRMINYFIPVFSLKSDGEYLITDNQNMPFGGFYPDHWTVNRFPVCHSLKKLLKKHQEAMKTAQERGHNLEGIFEQRPIVYSWN